MLPVLLCWWEDALMEAVKACISPRCFTSPSTGGDGGDEPVLGRSHQLLHVTHVFRAGLRCLKGVPGLANELEGRSSWLHTISDIIIFPGSNAGM